MESISNMNTINTDWTQLRNNYSQLKSKLKTAYDENMYSSMGMNSLLSMFDWDERIFRPELLDRILHDTGIGALIETDTSPYTPVFCNLVGGDRYADGFMKDCICFDLRGHSYSFSNWRENPKVLVFFNNYYPSGDNFIDKYASMLAQVDTSIMLNVIHSRNKPIPITKDQKTKNQIDAAYKDITAGNVKTVLADTSIRDITGGDDKLVDVLNLTNVEDSKYIQYLSHIYDSLISRLFFQVGLSVADNGKQAQITIDELNRNKSASLSLIMPWYIMRKRGFEDAKEKTGIDFKFDFSEIWKSEYETQTAPPEELNNNFNEGVEEDAREDSDTE